MLSSSFAANCRRMFLTAAVLASFAVFSQSSSAATVTLDYLGQGPYETAGSPTLNVYTNANGTGPILLSSTPNRGGVFKWKVLSSSGLPAGDTLGQPGFDGSSNTNHLRTFCIEISENIADPSTFNLIDLALGPIAGTNPLTPVGALGKLALQRLWKTSFADAVTSGLKAGAFQFAVWKLVYDSSLLGTIANNDAFNLSAGHARTTASALTTQANAYLAAALANTDPLAALPDLRALSSGTGGPGGKIQDQLVEYHDNSSGSTTDPVPEPASTVIWLLAGSGLFVSRMRRRKV